jgi:hypothetical protein
MSGSTQGVKPAAHLLTAVLAPLVLVFAVCAPAPLAARPPA